MIRFWSELVWGEGYTDDELGFGGRPDCSGHGRLSWESMAIGQSLLVCHGAIEGRASLVWSAVWNVKWYGQPEKGGYCQSLLSKACGREKLRMVWG